MISNSNDHRKENENQVINNIIDRLEKLQLDRNEIISEMHDTKSEIISQRKIELLKRFRKVKFKNKIATIYCFIAQIIVISMCVWIGMQYNFAAGVLLYVFLCILTIKFDNILNVAMTLVGVISFMSPHPFEEKMLSVIEEFDKNVDIYNNILNQSKEKMKSTTYNDVMQKLEKMKTSPNKNEDLVKEEIQKMNLEISSIKDQINAIKQEVEKAYNDIKD